MHIPDLINGLFEVLGGFILLLDVGRIYKDRVLRGVHWGPKVFFTAWGFWNVFYYPHLGQWISFAGGLFIVAVNTLRQAFESAEHWLRGSLPLTPN